MKVNVFSLPILLGNIDSNKIKFKQEQFKKNWHSETESSFSENSTNILEEDSAKYLMTEIVKILEEYIKGKFTVHLSNIWTNKYKENDYQEEHIHNNSHFSFIIYSNVVESNTIFISAYRELIQAFQLECLFENEFSVKCRSNQIVVFPSFMKHMVKRNKHAGETIAGNVLVRF